MTNILILLILFWSDKYELVLLQKLKQIKIFININCSIVLLSSCEKDEVMDETIVENENILICESETGVLYELTNNKEIV